MPKKQRFTDSFSQVTKTDAARATSSKGTRAGRYFRKTITLPTRQIQYIAEKATESQIGILAMYRWLIDQGLQQYEAGIRPVPLPPKEHDTEREHWTS